MVQITSQSPNKLIEGNLAVLVAIKVIEQGLDLGGGPAQSVLVHHLGELRQVNSARVVVIGDAELAADADNARGTVRLREERGRINCENKRN